MAEYAEDFSYPYLFMVLRGGWQVRRWRELRVAEYAEDFSCPYLFMVLRGGAGAAVAGAAGGRVRGAAGARGGPPR